jgi:glycopeptide antibiotics resistance protein
MQINKKLNFQSWGYWLLLAGLSFIIVATISPFNFIVPEGFSGKYILEEFNFGSSVKDYLQNILLFIPFGIGFTKIIANQYLRKNLGQILAIILLASAIISTTVELTQFLLPTRTSNLTDIIYNSLGGTLGGLIYCKHKEIIQFISGIVTGNPQKLSIKSILYAIAGYCLLVILGIWILLININLSNWDDDFYLAIGNEITGDRSWNGKIQSLYISDRSLNQFDVAEVFQHPDSFFAQLPSLVTSLVFTKPQSFYQDQQQQVPNLIWQGNSSITTINQTNSSRIQIPSILLNSQQWLKTEQSANLLIEKLKKTNEFSLSLIVASNEVNQSGPARIFVISKDTVAQNLIIGQNQTNLIFRLRTPITGNNASQPEFIVPNVFKDQIFHQILITFAQKKINFYIDQADNQYTFEFNPYNSFLAYFPWDKQIWRIYLHNFNLFKYQLLFYSIVLTPLLLLIAFLLYYLKISSIIRSNKKTRN